MNNFSFSHSVFKRLVLQTCKNQGLSRKGIDFYAFLVDGGLGIPVVLVVVEGGTDAIADAKSSLEHDIPVVVCSSTGRAADIIAYAYSHTKSLSG